MSEPTLESITDYDTLKGEKKKIVWSVIVVGLLLGVAYLIAFNVYDNKEDTIKTNDVITKVPVSKSIPVK